MKLIFSVYRYISRPQRSFRWGHGSHGNVSVQIVTFNDCQSHPNWANESRNQDKLPGSGFWNSKSPFKSENLAFIWVYILFLKLHTPCVIHREEGVVFVNEQMGWRSWEQSAISRLLRNQVCWKVMKWLKLLPLKYIISLKLHCYKMFFGASREEWRFPLGQNTTALPIIRWILYDRGEETSVSVWRKHGTCCCHRTVKMDLS